MPDDQDQGPWAKYAPQQTQEPTPWEKYGAKPAAAPSTPQTEEEKAQAQQRNATPTQFEKENTPSFAGEAMRTAAKIPLKAVGFDTNSQSPVSDWIKQNAGAALDLVRKTTPPGMLYDAVRGKKPEMPSVVSGVTNQMDDLSREARAEYKTGQSVEPAQANETGAYQSRPGGPIQKLGAPLEHPFLSAAMKEASSMVPVVGPAASRAGHSLARATTIQEKGEAIADAGGAAGQGFLATEPGQKLANDAIEKIGGPVNRSVVKPISEGVGNMTSRLRTPEAQQATTQAIQPSVTIPNAQRSISVAGPRIQQLKQAGMLTDLDGNPIHEIKSPGDLVSASRAAQKHIIGAIEDRLGPVADLQQDTANVAKDMRASVSKRVREQFPAQADAIDKRAATYEKPRTLRDINDAIIDANDDLKGLYKQAVPGESSSSASIKATQAEVKQLRQILDKGVENLSGDGVADLKREWGAQRDVERAAARQHAVATRQKGANLWEGLATLHAAGDLVSGNLLGAVRGAATMAVGKRLAVLRDPNYLLDQAFQGKKAFQAADAIPPHAGPPPPKGLLPRPPIQMPSGTPDTSGPVRGGRWTTPKALLPESTGTSGGSLKVTNEMGIRWAHSPDGKYRISIPKAVPDAELQSYAAKKLAEQKMIHEAMPKAVGQ